MILRILPAQEDTFGFIHLATGEIFNQAGIIAYFDSAGRDVLFIPCPDFEGFLAANSLCPRNISFLCDLPDYILKLGHQILEDNAYSSSNGRPDLSWLPKSPSMPTRSPSCHANVTTWTQRAQTLPHPISFRPDPNGMEAPAAPLSFAMGSQHSVDNFSPLTMSDVLSMHSI